ncbi:MAG TPA: hypothetical protein VNH18_18035 [Bryobacteraceae bacterium]|nr:hypothetical protein [Bryobacteraceae bacterium]
MKRKTGRGKPKDVVVTWTASDEVPEPDKLPEDSNVVEMPSSEAERTRLLAKDRRNYFPAGGHTGEGS